MTVLKAEDVGGLHIDDVGERWFEWHCRQDHVGRVRLTGSQLIVTG